MLTPIEIQNRVFKSGGLGYDKKDVDSFMKEISDSYEELYREKMELTDKVNVLNEGLQYYKTIEKTMQKALILAEKTADETKIAAQKTARQIEDEAITKSQIILSDAKNELERLHQQTVQLLQQYEAYKAQFKSLAAAQIQLLESDSFQINIATLPQPTFPEYKSSVPDEAAKKQTADEEELPNIDFSFVDAASEEK
ncbi:MAG: DivIVA domain-containing protein [Lachnospiraceae bacterium]